MSAFFSGLWVVLSLELKQRVRGKSWYILIGIFVALVALVTLALWTGIQAFGGDVGGGVFSTVIYFVLLLGTLVTPALSGNAINGDRDAGTLATTQVTLVTTWQLILGKFLAAWITALAFLVASTPFLVFAVLSGQLRADSILVSLLVLALELGMVAAVGVGLSGMMNRPLFSIVVTYLVVAALSVGTLIAFALAGLTTQAEVRTTYYGYDYNSTEFDQNTGRPLNAECTLVSETSYPIPRYDLYWGILVANPYVALADAVPTTYDDNGNVRDLFGTIKVGVRYAQQPIDTEQVYNDCDPEQYQSKSSREVIENSVPGWFVGLGLHVLLAAGALAGAWAKTRTPAGALSKGSRIA
jgi:ABC-type transport system involved in multi-copper enzyme maturation permease subunit